MQIVNGYVCKDCTDVDYAKKHIDPAHPKDGANGQDDPTKAAGTSKSSDSFGAAVKFGGSLSGPNGPSPTPSSSDPDSSTGVPDTQDPSAPNGSGQSTAATTPDPRSGVGSRLDITA